MFNKWVPTEKIFFPPKAIIGLPQNLFLGVRRHENYSHRGKLALKWGKIVWTARISVQMFSTIITGLKSISSLAYKIYVVSISFKKPALFDIDYFWFFDSYWHQILSVLIQNTNNSIFFTCTLGHVKKSGIIGALN